MRLLNGVERNFFWILGVLVIAIAGCGGSDVKPIAGLQPVTGTVKFDGKPLKTGTVSFEPVSGGSPAIGKIDASGNYSLMTSQSDRGAAPGDYKVAIVATEGVATMDKDGKPVPPKELIPEKYGSILSSELTATVAKGKKNVIDFNLTP
jgi:hypothetical protein